MNAYEQGFSDCYQDRCENVPFASVGGWAARPNIKAPDYVSYRKVGAYMKGYRACARKLWGDDYLTCSFGWVPVATIPAGGQ